MKFLLTSGIRLISQKTNSSSLQFVHTSDDLLVQTDETAEVFTSNKSNKVIILGRLIGFKQSESWACSSEEIKKYISDNVDNVSNYEWVNSLEGRFIIIVIKNNNDFWISADKFGKKDIFYQEREDGIAFSSNLSFLPGNPGADGYDQTALVHTLTYYGYRPPKQHTIYNNVRRLGVGEVAECQDGRSCIVKSTFIPRHSSNYEYSDHSTYKDSFLSYLEATGSKDGNIVFLSSGWDSTSILAGLVHIFGKKSVRGITQKMLYSERSGNCNSYEIERAKKFAEYFDIDLTIEDLNYASNGQENLSKVEHIFLDNQFHSFTAANHYLLAEATNAISNGNESIFAGEISDGAHNLGFSQYATIFHPSLDFREYSDKMASYLFGPTFVDLMLKGHHKDDPIYNLFLSRNTSLSFDEISKNPKNILKQVFVSMFLRNGRLPLWSGKNISMLTPDGLEQYTEEMAETYLKDFYNIETDQLYSSYLYLYNSFHWQSSTVASLQNMCDQFDMKSYLPFWGNDIQEFLSLMPENWGRGLDFNRTKYPLKEMLAKEIDYPINLQVGPHAYTYDVDHSFNHGNELIYHSPCNLVAKDVLKEKNYQDLLSGEFFNIEYLDKLVDQFVESDEPLVGSERDDLISLFLISKAGWYS